MKVKVYVSNCIEVEISDKHRPLAVSVTDPSFEGITEQQIDDCICEVEKVTGVQFGDVTNTMPCYVYAVESVENGEMLLEF
jgi:predicted amino acid racemase